MQGQGKNRRFGCQSDTVPFTRTTRESEKSGSHVKLFIKEKEIVFRFNNSPVSDYVSHYIQTNIIIISIVIISQSAVSTSTKSIYVHVSFSSENIAVFF